ncbi:TPA: hypothetical protein KEY68_003557 [Providencia rettgeri]|uniref:hypothetical protein n=1 Tax=Providencia TaxID=586 RepID=UPI000D36A151|nr:MULTISPECIES: hypothetical protein [Providencia]CAB5567480.1 Uncharacterised protein [Providencia rettgeri]CAC9131439.1 Uncharacterised protein [Providencia rettgeri]HBC7431257.1 hypothetical protein [Providencia rettgeri]
MDNYEYNVNVLMPSYYFEQDENWIREMLLRLRPSVRPKVSVKYSEVYQEHFDDEPISYKKINAGRKAANTRLRNFVKNYASYLDGHVSDPRVFQQGTSQMNQPFQGVA